MSTIFPQSLREIPNKHTSRYRKQILCWWLHQKYFHKFNQNRVSIYQKIMRSWRGFLLKLSTVCLKTCSNFVFAASISKLINHSKFHQVWKFIISIFTVKMQVKNYYDLIQSKYITEYEDLLYDTATIKSNIRHVWSSHKTKQKFIR